MQQTVSGIIDPSVLRLSSPYAHRRTGRVAGASGHHRASAWVGARPAEPTAAAKRASTAERGILRVLGKDTAGAGTTPQAGVGGVRAAAGDVAGVISPYTPRLHHSVVTSRRPSRRADPSASRSNFLFRSPALVTPQTPLCHAPPRLTSVQLRRPFQLQRVPEERLHPMDRYRHPRLRAS